METLATQFFCSQKGMTYACFNGIKVFALFPSQHGKFEW